MQGAEFFAAIVGAIVGGGISAAIQFYSFSEQERIRKAVRKEQRVVGEEAEREREALLAFSILTKINRALTALTQIREVLNKGLRVSIEKRIEFANAARAIASDPDRIEFTLEELALVRDLRRSDLLNVLLDLPYVLDGYVDNMSTFRRLRWEIVDLVSAGDVDRSGHAWNEFEGAAAFKAKVKIHESNTLLFAMWASIMKDYPGTKSLLTNLQSAFHDRLGRSRMKIEWDVSSTSREFSG